MCGIWSWTGKNKKNFNADKFNTLGIINETRGEHSCGISVDDDIHLGVGPNKVYRDFIADNTELLKVLFTPIVIGHTRHATGGAHNEANAHPFGFYDSELHTEYAFIGVHNGSLLDHTLLAIENNVEPSERTVSSTNVVTNRPKIDSEILLESIFLARNSDDPYKALREYKGAAALTFYFIDEPEVVYYYHGASKLYSTTPTATEERPLFYYRESDESLYTSSIEDSLKVIGGSDATIGEFKHNTVYKVTNGDIDNAETTTIDRSAGYQRRLVSTQNRYQGTTTPQTPVRHNNWSKPNNKNISELKNLAFEHPSEILEDIPSKIIFNRMRFTRNGHKVNGIYTYIPSHGFYFLHANNRGEAIKAFNRIVDKAFVEGNFVDEMFKDRSKAFIPFKDFNDNDLPEPLHYFKEGVLLKSYIDFMGLIATTGFKKMTDRDLSYASKHPVLIWDGVDNVKTLNIVWEGKPYSGTFSLFCTNRAYECKRGGLEEIYEYKECSSSCELPQDLGKEVDLNKLSKGSEDTTPITSGTKQQELVNGYHKHEDENSNQVEMLLEKFLFSTYASIPSHIAQLKKFNTNDLAAEGITTLRLIDELISELCPSFKELINDED